MKYADLLPFCSSDTRRQTIATPFTVGAYTYATDGRILIRVPALPEAELRDMVKVEGLIPEATCEYTEVECPPGWEDFQPATAPCQQCDGSGRRLECGECDGEGEVTCCECRHTTECDACMGDGTLKAGPGEGKECDACDGAGSYELPFWVACNRGAVPIDLKYLRKALLLPLPRLRYLATATASAVRIDFDGGAGVLLPGNPHRIRDNDGVKLADQWNETCPSVGANEKADE